MGERQRLIGFEPDVIRLLSSKEQARCQEKKRAGHNPLQILLNVAF
jgi:cytochrome b